MSEEKHIFSDFEKIINVDISKLKPHPQNEKLLPRLTQGELNRLKTRIKKYGFVEPIEITKVGTVLDGNNRIFKILTPYKKEFEDAGINVSKVPARVIDIPKSEEADYIISKNFDRRQLSKLMQSYIRGNQYNSMKKRHGGKRSSGQNDHLKNTAEKMAQKFGMAERTIRRDGTFTKKCDELILLTDNDFVFNLLNGEIKANKSLILKLHKLSKRRLEEIYEFYKDDKNFDIDLKDIIEENKQKKKKKRTINDIKKAITETAKKKGLKEEDLIEEVLDMLSKIK